MRTTAAHLLNLAAGEAERAHVPEHEVVVRAVRAELVPELLELLRQGLPGKDGLGRE